MNRHDATPPEIRRADFPALREFLRGYLHQDMQQEYGSVENAAKQFCRNADAEQRRAVAAEWTSLNARFNDRPLAEFNRALTRDLGSSQQLEPADVEKISAALKADL